MNPAVARSLRQVHTYLGVFFAPAIIFFAFSGALQTFSLHENEGGGMYSPPAWIVTIASIHKDQVLPRHPGKSPPPLGATQKPAPSPAGDVAGGSHAPKRYPFALKVFVLLLAIGLITTSLVGLYFAFTNRMMKRPALVVFVAGVLVPPILLFL